MHSSNGGNNTAANDTEVVEDDAEVVEDDAAADDSSDASGDVQVGIVLPTKDEPRWLQDQKQFEQILGNIFTKSLSMNNQKLGDDIVARVTENVSTKVIKEMDYFMRVREEAEDERFKKLDETIRGIQKCNKEAAAHKEKKGKNRKRFFNK